MCGDPGPERRVLYIPEVEVSILRKKGREKRERAENTKLCSIKRKKWVILYSYTNICELFVQKQLWFLSKK